MFCPQRLAKLEALRRDRLLLHQFIGWVQLAAVRDGACPHTAVRLFLMQSFGLFSKSGLSPLRLHCHVITPTVGSLCLLWCMICTFASAILSWRPQRQQFLGKSVEICSSTAHARPIESYYDGQLSTNTPAHLFTPTMRGTVRKTDSETSVAFCTVSRPAPDQISR
jgi:hypothetical protein